MTINEFCKNINVTQYIIKYYSITFDIDLFSNKYLVNNTSGWISDLDTITPEFITYFTKFQDEILEYEYDFFAIKKIEDIADKINVDVNQILNYLNNRKSYIKSYYLSENNEFVITSKIEKISSYQILKEIQLENRINLMTKNSKIIK